MRNTWRQRFEMWVTRGQTPAAHPVRLERRCIYILPTRYGYAFALLLLLLFLWSINYSNNMGFAFTFLLAAVAHNSMWQAHDALLGVVIHPARAEPMFVGQAASFQFQLDNPDPRPRYGIGVQWRDQPPSYGDLPAAGSTVLTVAIPALRRGWLRPGRMRILTCYPLGLLQAWSWVTFTSATLVYPAPQGTRPLPVALPGPSGGGECEHQELGSEDYAGFRPYAPGDSPRRIAWKAAGRSSELLVKRFTDQARPELWLDWSLLGEEPTETRLAQLCQWVLKAESAGYRYGLRLPGIDIPPGQGDAQQRRCLEALALFNSGV